MEIIYSSKLYHVSFSCMKRITPAGYGRIFYKNSLKNYFILGPSYSFKITYQKCFIFVISLCDD